MMLAYVISSAAWSVLGLIAGYGVGVAPEYAKRAPGDVPIRS